MKKTILALILSLAAGPIFAADVSYTVPINATREAQITVLVQAQNVAVYRLAQAYKPTINIVSSSVANPTTVTATAHNLITGDIVTIAGHTSTPTLNGSRTVTVTGVNTFTVPINVTVGGGATGTVTRTTSAITLSSTQADVCATLAVAGGSACTAVQARNAVPPARIYPQTQPGREEYFVFFELINAFPDLLQRSRAASKYLWVDWFTNVTNQAGRDAECANAGAPAACDLSQ